MSGFDHGLVYFRADDPPPGIKGTVYTFYPDEREFAACFRSLGNTLALEGADGDTGRIRGAVAIKKRSAGDMAKGFFTGRITFAPAWPFSALPVTPYLIFLATSVSIGIKHMVGIYPVLDSNLIFAESMLIGRAISAFFGVLTIILMHAFLRLLSKRREVIWTGTLLSALMPLGIVVSHYATYNGIVAFLEIMTLYHLVRFHEAPDSRAILRAGVTAGIALATKTTAGALIPLIAIAIAIRTEESLPERIKIAARTFGRLVATYAFLLSYSILTRFGDIKKSVFDQLGAVSGTFGDLAVANEKALIVSNFYGHVLPFSLSASVAALALVSVPLILFKALRMMQACPTPWTKTRALRSFSSGSRGVLLIGTYLGLWLAFSSFNVFNQAFRLLTLCLLVVLSVSILLDAISRRFGARWTYALMVIMLVHQSADAVIIRKFFTRPDIRFVANEWIDSHIPSGSRIGFFYEMAYNLQPTEIYTDYFWRRHKKFAYTADLSLDSASFPVDFIVTNRMDLLTDSYALYPHVDAIMESRGFVKLAEFEPDVALGRYSLLYECTSFYQPYLLVSKIFIYGRKPVTTKDPS